MMPFSKPTIGDWIRCVHAIRDFSCYFRLPIIPTNRRRISSFFSPYPSRVTPWPRCTPCLLPSSSSSCFLFPLRLPAPSLRLALLLLCASTLLALLASSRTIFLQYSLELGLSPISSNSSSRLQYPIPSPDPRSRFDVVRVTEPESTSSERSQPDLI